MGRTIGIFTSTDSHQENIRAPMMLAASAPVTRRMMTDITSPRPGTWTPSTWSGCRLAGSTMSVRSIVVTMKSSTHRVIASGSQISRPAIRYFLNMARSLVHPPRCALRDGNPVSTAGRAAAAAARGRAGGRGGGRRRTAVDLGVVGAFGTGFRLAALSARVLVAEIGGVPAAALQLKAG